MRIFIKIYILRILTQGSVCDSFILMNWPRSRILTLFVLFLLSIFRPNYAGEVTPKLDLEEVAKYGLTSLLVPKNFAPVFSRYPNWRGKLEFGANFQGVQVLEDGDKITEQLNIDALEVFVELDILATEAQESLIFKSSLMEMSSLVDQVGIPAGDNIFDRIEVVQSDFEFSNEVPTVFFLSFNQCGACHVLKSKIISHLSNGQFSEEAIERLNKIEEII